MSCGKRHFGYLMVGIALSSAGCVPYTVQERDPLARGARPAAETTNLAFAQAPSEPQTLPPPPSSPAHALPPQVPLPLDPPPAKTQDASMPPGRDTAPPPTPPTVTPNAEPPSTDPVANLRRLNKQAEEACAAFDSYICRMTRREQVNGTNKPEEMMLFKFRKQPFSVYFKWIGKEGNGREVVYVKGQHGGKLHTLLAAGDSPLQSAGSRMSLAPDSFLVRRSSRHPITDAGICAILDKYGATVAAAEKGQRTVRFLGTVKRPDYDTDAVLEGAEEDLPPGADPNLPRGGRRQLYFDSASHLPVLAITKDERGQEVEYYRFDRFQKQVKLDDDDFNPDKLWRR